MSEQIDYFPPNLDLQPKASALRPRLGEWKLLDTNNLDSLAAEITQRVKQPIDSLEIAALIESLGVTDEVATRRYGARDVFDLAETVFEQLRASGLPASFVRRQPDPPLSICQAWADYVRGPMSVGTVLVLLFIMSVYRQLGQWGQSQVLALSLGMTGSLLVTNGFVQAASRRGSIFLSRGNSHAAVVFLRTILLIAGVCSVMVASLSGIVAARLRLFGPEDQTIFVLAFVGLAAIWLLAAVLSLAQVPGWLGVGLVAGLVAGMLVDRVVSLFSSIHLLAGTFVGFGISIGLMLRAARRAIYATVSQNAPSGPVTLPTVAYLVHEAIPYFAYGLLYMVFILLPHLIGWVGVVQDGLTRMGAVSHLEFALTLALAPLMLTSGVSEWSIRQFWGQARTAQIETPGQAADEFGRRLFWFYWRQLAVYLMILVLISLIIHTLFQVALNAGLVRRWLQLDDQAMLLGMFQVCLVAYFLLGWGLFNCMFSVTLARPEFASRAIVMGMIATVGVGVPLSLVCSFSLAPASFVAGALTFAVSSLWSSVRLFRSADYYYYSSF
jgi:hypothetical protein